MSRLRIDYYAKGEVIAGVLVPFLVYAAWSASAGTTICLKLIADFILSRQALLNATINKSKQ